HNVTADRGTLLGIDPRHPTFGIVRHETRKLVGTFSIEPGKADETPVRLQPAAAVTARLLDDSDGSPLADKVVIGLVHPTEKRHLWANFSGRSGKDGKVRIEMIPSGVPVSGEVQHFTGRTYKMLPVFEKLTLKPGEVRELGDVRVRLDANDNPEG